MALDQIGIGTVADDGTGDPLRTAFTKVNSNFSTLAGSGGAAEVGYVSSGTGATTEDVQEVLRLIGVTPDQFGAVGDDTTNDKAALQAAYDAIKTSGGVLYLGKGKTYLCNSALTLDGTGVLITGPGTIRANVNIRPIEFNGATNNTLRGIKLLGTEDGTNGTRAGLVAIENSTDIRIESCWLDKATSSPIVIGGSSAVSRVRIVGNTVTNYYETGVDIVTGVVDDVLITGNTFTTASVHPNGAVSRPMGIAVEPQLDGSITDLVISNNTISLDGLSTTNMNTTHGISINKASTPATNWFAKRVIITGNTIRGVGHGLRLQDTCYGTTDEGFTASITNNIFERCRNDGMEVRGGESSTHNHVVVITGNIIKGYSEQTTNGFDGIILDQHLAAPVVVGNHIARRIAETGAANGRNAINIASVNVVNAVVQGNYLDNAATLEISDSGTTTNRRNNQGFKTEASGTATVNSGATTAVVTHGLAVTPTVQNIHITFNEAGSNDYGRWWVDTITSTQFTLNVSADPGANNLTFGWQAICL